MIDNEKTPIIPERLSTINKVMFGLLGAIVFFASLTALVVSQINKPSIITVTTVEPRPTETVIYLKEGFMITGPIDITLNDGVSIQITGVKIPCVGEICTNGVAVNTLKHYLWTWSTTVSAEDLFTKYGARRLNKVK